MVALLPALRIARFGLAVAIVVAMGVIAVRDVPFGSLDWWLLAPAFAAAAVWWTLLSVQWAVLASGRVSLPDMGTWCRTQVLRYLPGGIWAPTSRVLVVKGSAVDRIATVAAENVVALCAALAVGGGAFALGGRVAWAPFVLALAIPGIAAPLTAGRTRLERRRLVGATATALPAFLLYVVAAVLVQASVSGMHEPLLVAGAAGISWAVGLVVVIAPGGLGVRELAYTGLLAADFGHDDLAAAAVVMRAVTIAAELLILIAAGHAFAESRSKSS
jgi:hypothetical protein